MSKIDLSLLCGARPTLIEQTLASFSEKVFCNFDIDNVFANIDPFMGGPEEVLRVERCIVDRFPQAIIRKPENPSFTGAVMWLWSSVSAPFCLHLEDDWVALHPITPDQVLPHFSSAVRQVSFLVEEKKWRYSSRHHCKVGRRRILGLKLGKRLLRHEPIFTTSPSFIEREFARTCASLMDERLDPEKQLYDGHNPELRAYTRRYRNRLVGFGPPFWLRDIGRDFRQARGLDKALTDGRSSWYQRPETVDDAKSPAFQE